MNPSPAAAEQAHPSRPHLALLTRPRGGGVVLVMHGGREQSTAAVHRHQLAVVRVELLARSLTRDLSRRGIGVAMLRFAVRGWNGPAASPVADARWALQRLRQDLGELPAVLIGHSMGGRTALRVAGSDQVRGVIALAPWVPVGEPVDQLAGRRVAIVHGTLDRVTAPADSLRYAERARELTPDVVRYEVRGDGHGMLRRPRTWSHLCREGVTGAVSDVPPKVSGLSIQV